MFSLFNFIFKNVRERAGGLHCGLEFSGFTCPSHLSFFLLLGPRTSLFNAPDVYSLNNYVIEIQVLLSVALH